MGASLSWSFRDRLRSNIKCVSLGNDELTVGSENSRCSSWEQPSKVNVAGNDRRVYASLPRQRSARDTASVLLTMKIWCQPGRIPAGNFLPRIQPVINVARDFPRLYVNELNVKILCRAEHLLSRTSKAVRNVA